MKFSDVTSDLRNQQMAEMLFVRWLMLGAALLFCLAIAYWIGSEQRTYLYLCVGLALLVAVTVGLRERAWLLILVGWAFVGKTQVLPIPLSVRDMAVLLATCAYIGYRVLSKRDMKQRFHVLDVLIAVNVAYLVLNFIRHPVGFGAFGSEMIGGRFYFNVFIAVLAYWVVVRLPDSAKTVSRIPYFILAGAAMTSALQTLAYIYPSLTPRLYFLYSSLDLDMYLGSTGSSERMIRLKGLAFLGYPLMLLLCSYYPPRTLLYPVRGRFYAMLLGIGCLLASGFRNILLRAFVAFGLGSWLHRGWREMVAAMALGATLLAMVLAGQGRLYELPLAAQRALAFLPAKWASQPLADAESSSQWRFELWRTVIRERLIDDWWFGDGFGISQANYQAMGRPSEYNTDVIVSGGYHNGPLTAIRFAGVVGLVLIYALMIANAISSYRCVQQCRGTILLPVAIYLAIHLVWEPVHFTFVFGGYDGAMPEYIFYAALLRVVSRMSVELRARAAAQSPAAAVAAAPATVNLPA